MSLCHSAVSVSLFKGPSDENTSRAVASRPRVTPSVSVTSRRETRSALPLEAGEAHVAPRPDRFSLLCTETGVLLSLKWEEGASHMVLGPISAVMGAYW